MSIVTFNVNVTMDERWVNAFCTMLNHMQYCGNSGHSDIIGFYADGDGDFRPEFKIEQEYEKNSYLLPSELSDGKTMPEVDIIFDADIER